MLFISSGHGGSISAGGLETIVFLVFGLPEHDSPE
jgi:hypothetical protein